MSEPIEVGDQVIGICDGWVGIISEVLAIYESTFLVRVLYCGTISFVGNEYHAPKVFVQRYMP